MVSGIYNLIDGSLVQKARFDNISNNLANINSTAFKKDIIAFDQAMSESYLSKTDFTPGPNVHTGNPLDLCIPRSGFFKIRTADGIKYTRNGSFALNGQGVLVTRNGDPVIGERGEIQISGNDVSIDESGRVEVDGQEVNRLSVVDFAASQLMTKTGSGYFVHRDGEEAELAVKDPTIQQGYIEQSNVNPTEEMIKMIETFRAYESSQRAIQSLDEMTRKMVNDYAMQQ